MKVMVAQHASGASDSITRIERALGELWRVASSSRLHEARQRATGSRLSLAEFRFLRRVADCGDVSVSHAAAVLGVSQPTASRTLHQLEVAGLVARAEVVSDGRMAIYRVTSSGRREQQRLERHMQQQLEAALFDVPPTRRAQQAALLEDLVVRLRAGELHPDRRDLS